MKLNAETREQFMRIAKARLNKWYTFPKQRDAWAAKMYVDWYNRKISEERQKNLKSPDYRFLYWDD